MLDEVGSGQRRECVIGRSNSRHDRWGDGRWHSVRVRCMGGGRRCSVHVLTVWDERMGGVRDRRGTSRTGRGNIMIGRVIRCGNNVATACTAGWECVGQSAWE